MELQFSLGRCAEKSNARPRKATPAQSKFLGLKKTVVNGRQNKRLESRAARMANTISTKNIRRAKIGRCRWWRPQCSARAQSDELSRVQAKTTSWSRCNQTHRRGRPTNTEKR